MSLNCYGLQRETYLTDWLMSNNTLESSRVGYSQRSLLTLSFFSCNKDVMILDDSNMARLIIRCLTPEVYIPLGIVSSATILVRVAPLRNN